MANWDAKTWLYLVVGVLSAVEPHVADFVAPGVQPRLASAFAGVIAALSVVLGVLDESAPKDKPLVKAAASGALGADAKFLASDSSKAAATRAASVRPPPINPAAGALMIALACSAYLSLQITACSWFGAHGAQVAIDVGQLTACVLEHDQEPVTQIAVDCGGLAVSDVEAILSAHRAANKRELPAGCAK